MHIILGILGAIVTILILLNRLAEAGIDLGGLNPFSARRLRKWQQKFEGNPLFALDDPVEVAAVLVVATANIAGVVTAEERTGDSWNVCERFSSEPEAGDRFTRVQCPPAG